MERPHERNDDVIAEEREERNRPGEDQPVDSDQGHSSARTATAERDIAGQDEPVADERMTAAATHVPPIADEQLTVPEDRDAAAAAPRDTADRPTPSAGDRFELFGSGDAEGFRQRWENLQAGFVDDPRGATEKADALVGEMVERVSRRHGELRDELGRRSDGGGDTEAMRLALRQYRELYAILLRS
jgi:hypothetical protein